MALSKKQKLIALSTVFLLLVTIISIISCLATQTTHKKITDPTTHALVKNSCGTTLYPDLCYTSISQLPKDATSKIKTFKDVIDITLDITIVAAQHNYFTIKKQIDSHKNFTEQEKTALHDCLETADDTLEELHEAQADLHGNNSSVKKSVAQHADDVMTLLSAAMTNQETCLEGFTYNKTDRKIGDVLSKGEMHAFKMCSNILAMVKDLVGKDMAEQRNHFGRKLGENEGKGWPGWLSAGDRRLLREVEVVPNVTVAADGSGNFTKITEAVAAAPNKSETRYIIKIKAGVYRENVEVPKKKWNIMFIGDGKANTIITGNRNVVDGSTTFHSATVAAVGQRFLARDITFENTAGPTKHQAVALRVGSDLSAFYNCDMVGYQDTLYVHSLRQFYVKCIIIGTVDFIFGNGAAVFQDCDIRARRPNSGQKNMITAQGRDDPNQNTGIVIQGCRIGATEDLEATKSEFPSFLGRPWKQFSRTVVMQSIIGDVINPIGWHEWHGDFALDTLFYAEYENSGPGAETAKRVPWKGFRVITNASEAEPFTAENFIKGNYWLNSTGFPFSLGL